MREFPLKIDQASIDFISRVEAASDAASTSIDDRGRQLELACRVAWDIEEGRRKSGLPPSAPAPWPESTWRFLKEQAQHVGH
jgi:hypothetical protein